MRKRNEPVSLRPLFCRLREPVWFRVRCNACGAAGKRAVACNARSRAPWAAPRMPHASVTSASQHQLSIVLTRAVRARRETGWTVTVVPGVTRRQPCPACSPHPQWRSTVFFRISSTVPREVMRLFRHILGARVTGCGVQDSNHRRPDPLERDAISGNFQLLKGERCWTPNDEGDDVAPATPPPTVPIHHSRAGRSSRTTGTYC